MKKYLFLFLFLLSTMHHISGQKYEKLNNAGNLSGLSDHKSVIYGLFVQRLGFTSGGFPQEIRLVNVITKKFYTFNVKSTMKSSKKNFFIYYIEPGLYRIVNYYWTKSTWYGGEIHEEMIFKDIDTSNKEFRKKAKLGLVDPESLEPYYFEIRPNTINYLGTWHFDKGLVYFTDDKSELDEKLENKNNLIDLNSIIINLPN